MVATIVLVLLFMCSSCGYRLTPVGGIVPEVSKTIAIPVFLNATNEPMVDIVMTQAVVNEFFTDGRLKITSPENADLILRGKITKFDLTPAAYTSDPYVQSYNVSIMISFTLEDTKTGKMLLVVNNLSTIFISSYSVTLGGIAVTKAEKETAIQNSSRDVASTIRSRVLEGF
jgi:hypothetical protein